MRVIYFLNVRKMSKKEKQTIEIDGKQVDIAKYFCLLSPTNHGNQKNVTGLDFDGYTELMGCISDVIKVCSRLLCADSDNMPIFEMGNVLSLVDKLLPYNEMELLDEIQNKAHTNSKEKN